VSACAYSLVYSIHIMFIWTSLSYWWETLKQALGLAGKQGQLLLLGLDNAGKTTLLHHLRTGPSAPLGRTFPPTDRPSREQLVWTGGIQFTAWDLGGHEAVRHLWEDYLSSELSAILFLVDASDGERIEEAGYELDHLLHTITQDKGEGIPVALLLNKCDLAEALPSVEILQKMDYANLQNYQAEKYMRVFRISVLKSQGYAEAFQWIGTFLR
jgi:GTP-binding protein SAR1